MSMFIIFEIHIPCILCVTLSGNILKAVIYTQAEKNP